MARLQSLAAAGYYKTPPRVAHAIASHLAATSTRGTHVIRVLDPCAGTGEAAAIVAQALGAESYGIELHDERAEAARRCLNQVLVTSAFAVRIAHGAFSCLWLNAPYDDSGDAQRRTEHMFLTAMTRTLCPGGVLVFIIPQRRLEVSARYLASHYTGFLAFRFPDPEFERFEQMVLLTVRKRQPSLDPANQERLQGWSRDALAPLPDVPAGAPVLVPAAPAGPVLFASLLFDPARAAAEARRCGVWAQPHLAEQLWPSEERPVRPLMPLRKGHIALLIAAGMIDNVVLGDSTSQVLVKGRTHKSFVQVESADAHIQIEREVLHTSVTVLDLHTGTLQTLDQGANVGVPLPATERAA